MGDVIDATGHFRMRRLEADVERADRKVIRADTHPKLFNDALNRVLSEGIRAGVDKEIMDDIILPPSLEED